MDYGIFVHALLKTPADFVLILVQWILIQPVNRNAGKKSCQD